MRNQDWNGEKKPFLFLCFFTGIGCPPDGSAEFFLHRPVGFSLVGLLYNETNGKRNTQVGLRIACVSCRRKNASMKKLEIYSGGASDAKSIREKTA